MLPWQIIRVNRSAAEPPAILRIQFLRLLKEGQNKAVSMGSLARSLL